MKHLSNEKMCQLNGWMNELREAAEAKGLYFSWSVDSYGWGDVLYARVCDNEDAYPFARFDATAINEESTDKSAIAFDRSNAHHWHGAVAAIDRMRSEIMAYKG